MENMGRALQDRGVSVTVVSLYPGTSTSRLPTRTVVHHEALHKNPTLRGQRNWKSPAQGIVKFVWKVIEAGYIGASTRRYFRSLPADACVVHLHPSTRGFLETKGAIPLPESVVEIGQYHSSFDWIDLEVGQRQLVVDHYRQIDAMMALTESDARRFHDLLGIPAYGVANPYSPGHSVTPTCAFSNTSETPDSSTPRTAIGIVRFSPEKQVDLMVRAFTSAISRGGLEHWSLDIYGEGPEEARVRDAIAASPYADRIHLRGVVQDTSEPLGRASAHLSTSTIEGFGMSILEASRQAVPTVAFACSPGVVEQLDEQAGFLVHDLTEEAYADALHRALSDPEQLYRRGLTAQARSEHYSPRSIVDQWHEILRRLSMKGT